MPIHVKNQTELNLKLEEAGDTLVIVDFFATWCGPCKMMAPKLEELATEYAGQIIILKVDVDECEDLAQHYNVSSMPTFIFIKNKITVEIFTGANSDKVRTTALRHV